MKLQCRTKGSTTEKLLWVIPCLVLLFPGARYFDDILWAIEPKHKHHPGPLATEQAARSLSGWGAIQCGRFLNPDNDIMGDSCAISAFRNKQPFRVFHFGKNVVGDTVESALVGNAQGEVFMIHNVYWQGSVLDLEIIQFLQLRIGKIDQHEAIVFEDAEIVH